MIRTAIIRTLAVLFLLAALDGHANAQRVFLQPAGPYSGIGRVEVDLGNGAKAAGSCILLDDMHALTAAHCACGSVMTVQVNGLTIRGKVIAMELKNDWALVRLPEPIPGVKGVMIRQEPLRVGERVYAYGYGSEYGRFGSVSGTYQGEHITGTLVEEGDSGGPILDSQGRLVGVVMGYVVQTFDWYGKSCASQKFRDFIQLRRYESTGLEIVD